MKAKDIFKMWIHKDAGIGYEMYVFLLNQAEGKTIQLVDKKNDDIRNLWIHYEETRFIDLTKVRCDLRNGSYMWLNLKYRGFTINNIDNFKGLQLDHFETDKDTGKLVFVFSYKGGVL